MSERAAVSGARDGKTASNDQAPPIDIVERLHLDDPTKRTIYDYYIAGNDQLNSRDQQVDAMLARFGVDDPVKFAQNVHKLDDQAKHDGLEFTQSTMDRYVRDKNLPGAERVTAQVLRDNFRTFAELDRHALDGFKFTGYLKMDGGDFAKIDRTAANFDTVRKHPEVRDPRILAATLAGMRSPGDERVIKDWIGMSLEDGEYSGRRAAAAVLLTTGENYYKLKQTNHDASWNMNQQTLDNISNIGKPKPADWVDRCIAGESINVLGASAQSAAIGAMVGPRDRRGRTAATAAATTAVIASIHNANLIAGCKAEYEATK